MKKSIEHYTKPGYIIIRFLTFAIPFIIIVLFGLIHISNWISKNIRREIITESDYMTTIISEEMKSFFHNIRDDLLVLGEDAERRIAVDDGISKNALCDLFRSLLHHKEYYQQIKTFDAEGTIIINEIKEGIRIFNNNEDNISPDVLELPPDTIYHTDFRLSTIGGVPELPIRPIITFAVPLDDPGGNRLGVLTLRVSASSMEKIIRNTAEPAEDLYLVDDEGRIIVAPFGEYSWTHVLAPYSEEDFPDNYPEAWNFLAGKDSSSIETREGFFTSAYFTIPEFLNYKNIDGKENCYYLVLHTPPSRMQSLFRMDSRPWIISFSVISLLLLCIMLLWVFIRRNRQVSRLQLEEAAYIDPLTQVLNRRSFLEAAERERSRADRYGLPVSIVVADIDNFKKINDKFGHPGGDAVLKTLAQLMKDTLRIVDLICRWGGEEFIFLLPRTRLEQAVETASRLRINIEEYPIQIEHTKIQVTMSMGVAEYRNTLDETILEADKYLYEAKTSGKNSVCPKIEDKHKKRHSGFDSEHNRLERKKKRTLGRKKEE
jgi:diguanylate cyclase (GGDEF)-like protein